MEEYEIRDVARRGEVPDLQIEFELPKTELIFNQEDTFSVPFPLQSSIRNDALEPANYAVITLYIDERLAVQNTSEFTVKEGLVFVIGEKNIPVKILQFNWNISARMPIFHAQFTITTNPITLRSPSNGRLGQPKYYLLGYDIKSPRMPIKNSFALLEVRSGYIWLSDNHLTAEQVLANYDKLEK